MPSGSAMAVEEDEEDALIQSECACEVLIRGSLGEQERREKDELDEEKIAFDKNGLLLKLEQKDGNSMLFGLRE